MALCDRHFSRLEWHCEFFAIVILHYTHTVTMSSNTYTVTFFADIGNILPLVPNDCHQMSTPNTNGIKIMIGNSNFFQKSERQNLVCMLSSYLCWSIKIKSRQKTFRFPLFFCLLDESGGCSLKIKEVEWNAGMVCWRKPNCLSACKMIGPWSSVLTFNC